MDKIGIPSAEKTVASRRTNICTWHLTRKTASQIQDIFFDVRDMARPHSKYVAFVDIMGMKATLFRSFNKSTIFMGKLHSVLAELDGSDATTIYPVMDGAYLVAEVFESIIGFMRKVYDRISDVFLNTEKLDECFIARGGLAFGPVRDGKDITGKVSRTLAENTDYKRHLLFGLPITLAFEGEKQAPPFGIFIDTTVRAELGDQVSGIWYKWCKDSRKCSAIHQKLLDYFAWAKSKNVELRYEDADIDRHSKLSSQFWK